jgi:hypothetical protein
MARTAAAEAAPRAMALQRQPARRSTPRDPTNTGSSVLSGGRAPLIGMLVLRSVAISFAGSALTRIFGVKSGSVELDIGPETARLAWQPVGVVASALGSGDVSDHVAHSVVRRQ